MRIEIPINSKLYRADTSLPPKSWDTSMNLRTNYGNKYPEMGPKNIAELLFFHDHIDVSHSYAKGLKSEKVTQSFDKYYLTETILNQPLTILDFSNDFTVYQMFETLHNQNIVIPETMVNHYSNDPLSFTYGLFLEHKRTHDWRTISKIKITKECNEVDASYFGQLLTDFENGPVFKEILIEQGLDGYRWREHNDPRGLTYCLIDSTKLSPPISSSFNF
jgi:hypothetical protein